ncbi:hypothetical protein MOK15_07455 [Sphingobium sp. BYY-5]|uniref:hypothetical protein n=1 Tax=Sphingobium sp. BYY-5 TaxID=2926400 RepID=UPI001FA732B0|nr:hypothetical protein [Sphingobium sp. BYY-5]MCI4589926.1 hypothetical protein [Sphingobium sp. BYY-5]
MQLATIPQEAGIYAAACTLRSAKRRRATSATAAAPKSRTIGGAGTSVPPVLVDPPLELLELLLDEALLLDVEEEELPVLPKLDDPPDEDELPDDPLLPLEPG